MFREQLPNIHVAVSEEGKHSLQNLARWRWKARGMRPSPIFSPDVA